MGLAGRLVFIFTLWCERCGSQQGRNLIAGILTVDPSGSLTPGKHSLLLVVFVNCYSGFCRTASVGVLYMCRGPASAEKWVSILGCLEGEVSTRTQDSDASWQVMSCRAGSSTLLFPSFRPQSSTVKSYPRNLTLSCHRLIIPWAKQFTRSIDFLKSEHHHHTSQFPNPCQPL